MSNKQIQFHLAKDVTSRWFDWEADKELIDKYLEKVEFFAIESKELMTKEEFVKYVESLKK
mgnify:CR=1 FL=1